MCIALAIAKAILYIAKCFAFSYIKYKICKAYLIHTSKDVYTSLDVTKKEIYKERKVFLSLVKDCKATAQLCNARLLLGLSQ